MKERVKGEGGGRGWEVWKRGKGEEKKGQRPKAEGGEERKIERGCAGASERVGK